MQGVRHPRGMVTTLWEGRRVVSGYRIAMGSRLHHRVHLHQGQHGAGGRGKVCWVGEKVWRYMLGNVWFEFEVNLMRGGDEGFVTACSLRHG